MPDFYERQFFEVWKHFIPNRLIKQGISEHIRDIDRQIQKKFLETRLITQNMMQQFRNVPIP